MELVKIDHKEFGIQETKAKEISAMFKPMLDKMVELEDKANEVMALPMGPEAYAKARELRLEYKKTRTGTANIHKEAKAYTVKMGRFIDGWKNAQQLASHGMEEKLAAIENHEAIEEEKRIKALQEKRTKSLKKFEVDVVPENLGEMDKETWGNYLTGTRVNFENKQKEAREREEKARKDELERQEREKKLALKNERMLLASPLKSFIPSFEGIAWDELSFSKLQAILDKAKSDKEAKDKEDERIRQENEKLQAEAREREERAEQERKDREKKAEIERKEKEEALRKEREKREKVERDLAERERKEKAEKKKREREKQALLSLDDAGKVKNLINDLAILAGKYTFKSEKNQKMYKGVVNLIGKIITYIKQSQ